MCALDISMATEPRWSTICISKEAKISSCESACAWYLSYGRMALETLGADGGFQRLPGSDKRWGDKRRAVMLPRGPDESRCRYERPTGRFLFSDIAPRSSILDPGGGKGLTTPFSTKRRVRCSDSTSLVSEVMSVHRQAKTRGRQAGTPYSFKAVPWTRGPDGSRGSRLAGGPGMAVSAMVRWRTKLKV